MSEELEDPAAEDWSTPTILDLLSQAKNLSREVIGEGVDIGAYTATSHYLSCALTEFCPENPQDRRPPPDRDKESEQEKENAEKELMLELVKQDLSRYAVAYEAGRIESMNKDQVQIMEEKVRLMKELQREFEEEPKQGVETMDISTEVVTEEETSSEEDT